VCNHVGTLCLETWSFWSALPLYWFWIYICLENQLSLYLISHVTLTLTEPCLHQLSALLFHTIVAFCLVLFGCFLSFDTSKWRRPRCRSWFWPRGLVSVWLLQLMTFGFFLCVDAFLYVFTLLPLRVLLAGLRLLTLPCCGFRSEPEHAQKKTTYIYIYIYIYTHSKTHSYTLDFSHFEEKMLETYY